MKATKIFVILPNRIRTSSNLISRAPASANRRRLADWATGPPLCILHSRAGRMHTLLDMDVDILDKIILCSWWERDVLWLTANLAVG